VCLSCWVVQSLADTYDEPVSLLERNRDFLDEWIGNITSVHTNMPDVSPENILAMVNAALEFVRYGS
jgi:hypothetical protein